jgi:hypothetical protein
MKGIYLTEEGKQEIKEELLRIENESINYAEDELNDITAIKTRYNILKEILECATILPIEESWDIVNEKTDYGLSDREVYPNGVIIKTKE